MNYCKTAFKVAFGLCVGWYCGGLVTAVIDGAVSGTIHCLRSTFRMTDNSESNFEPKLT